MCSGQAIQPPKTGVLSAVSPLSTASMRSLRVIGLWCYASRAASTNAGQFDSGTVGNVITQPHDMTVAPSPLPHAVHRVSHLFLRPVQQDLYPGIADRPIESLPRPCETRQIAHGRLREGLE